MSPYANFRHVNLDSLYMGFVQPLLDAVAELNARGLTYQATAGNGFRTYREQRALWCIGRTQRVEEKPVTDARPGESPHNFGLACDFVRVVNGKADWCAEDYQPLGEVAEKHGLVWGGRWAHRDRPHVQLAGYVTAADLEPLRHVFEGQPGGLTEVFRYLDSKEKP